MITTLNRGSLSELHAAIIELENRGYQVIAPATKIEEEKIRYKRGKYTCLASVKWACVMKKERLKDESR